MFSQGDHIYYVNDQGKRCEGYFHHYADMNDYTDNDGKKQVCYAHWDGKTYLTWADAEKCHLIEPFTPFQQRVREYIQRGRDA